MLKLAVIECSSAEVMAPNATLILKLLVEFHSLVFLQLMDFCKAELVHRISSECQD